LEKNPRPAWGLRNTIIILTSTEDARGAHRQGTTMRTEMGFYRKWIAFLGLIAGAVIVMTSMNVAGVQHAEQEGEETIAASLRDR
jgi:hypothetical protein